MSALRCALVALAALLCPLAPAGAAERILLFVSDAQVQANGDLVVTETTLVRAEGRAIQHGIQRDFPTRYSRSDGTRVEIGFEVESVTRDGRREPYSLLQMNNGVRVRIGRADATVSVGEHEYVVRYRTTRQIGFYRDFDELYWNATGNASTFPIDSAEARITLPARVPLSQAAFYTGPQGARGTDAEIISREPGRIVFRTTRVLPPGSGLTVAVAWPKGVVTEPTRVQQFGAFVRDNLAVAASVVGFLLLLGYYAFAYLKVGRDPRRGTIVPLFAAPDGMSAAAVRFVRRMGFDNRVFSAAILDLAVRGHLKLSDVGKHMQVDRREGGKEIDHAESVLASRLFASSPSVLLTQKNQKTLSSAGSGLQAALAKAYQDTLFRNNFGWAGFGLLVALFIAVAVIIMLFALHPDGQHATFVEVGAGILAIVGVVFAGSSFGWLKAHTPDGRKIVDQIEGLRLYLGTAEEARLEALNPPQKTAELFERFLPYAVALDVENSWGRRFSGVLAAAAAAAAAQATDTTSWYSGSHDFINNPSGFADHVGGHLSQTIAAAATPPGSSGGTGFGSSSGGSSSASSGGGSSGGGGGGGGTSGW